MDKVTQQAERMAAAAAAAAAAEDKADAAAAAAAAADQKLLSLQSQLKAKEAELNVLTQQNEQLRDQRTLMQQQADATAAAHVKATASPSSSPTASTDAANLGPAVASSRLREVLMSQVECNMLLLDKLGSLAQTVVGLPGLDASDRVKLASTISQCVLAVGAVQIPEDMLAASDSQAHAQQEE
jgi:small-conductance mechanosensitive channel